MLGNKAQPTQVEARLRERLESLNACKQSPWNIDLDLWFNRNTNNWQCLLRSGPSCKETVLLGFKTTSSVEGFYQTCKADSQAIVLVDKLQSAQSKNTINLKGAEYSFGDFIVRFGSVFERKTPSFVVVEIVYALFLEEKDSQRVFFQVMKCLCNPTTLETSSSDVLSSEASRREQKGQEQKKGENSQRLEDTFQYFPAYEFIKSRSPELSDTAVQFLLLLYCL